MRSFKTYEGDVVVTSQVTIKAVVVGSLCVVQLHRVVFIIAEVTIVDCRMVCVDCVLRVLLLLVGRVLGAVSQ
jgi:hypothetical protein